ncbi:NADH-ubiquinone oxidoreductase 17.8 kDa subunit [Sarocladium implicatum]|nr:NADH-ubiquinone oxidoreductase 17.8 kDa subunit [Sarocladium implicatum]
MYAARQRVTCAARQLPRSARTYASDAHAKPTNESFGKGSMIVGASVVAGLFVYQIVPGDNKDKSSISNLISKYSSRNEQWEEINARHTKAEEQAGFDRNLFANASSKERTRELAYPEAFGAHAPRNIRAGSLINLDHVVEHYRQEHLKDEEIKAAKLAARKA